MRPFIERFEQAWQAGKTPDLASFLPVEPGIRKLVLRELIFIDLELRIKIGEAARVEDYLKSYAELANDDRLVLELASYEFELRQRAEPSLAVEEYVRRFPAYETQLKFRLRPTPIAGAAVPISLDDFFQKLGEQILEPGQIAELAALRPRFPDSRALAAELLSRQWLTAFQVNRVLQGRGSELTLGPYLLQDRLGEGGMGAVFKAWHRLMHRTVALKVIRRDRLDGADAVRRFQREMRAAAQVSHPNIVMAHDAAQVGDTHFLVMEYFEGTDLARLVKKRGALPVAQACNCVRQAALGLQHAHERGMVHRDIKPANLLLTQAQPSGATERGGVIKVLDLGLARIGRDEPAHTSLTHAGMLMGTPDFMAPEQAVESHSVDIRADVYSLGCTLYYLLTARVPFPGGTILQKLRKHERDQPAPITAFRTDVPPGLLPVLARMMAKGPEHRYQTPSDVGIALAPFCTALTPHALPVAPDARQNACARPPAGSAPASIAAMPPADTVARSLQRTVTYDRPASSRDSSDTLAADAAPLKPSPQRRTRWTWMLPAAGCAATATGLLLATVAVLWFALGRPQGAASSPDTSKVVGGKPPSASPPGKPPTIEHKMGMQFVLIPPGTYRIGTPASEMGSFENERPLHDLVLAKPFYLGVYPVTVGQFRKFVQSGSFTMVPDENGSLGVGYDRTASKIEIGKPWVSWEVPGWKQSDDHPVVNVSWKDAVKFCEWLSGQEGDTYRLPSEAEWEAACRARTTTRFWCGDDYADLEGVANVADQALQAVDAQANFRGCMYWNDGYPFTSPVGVFKKANPFGLHDMHGNVFQWCQDFWHENYSGAPQNGSPWVTDGNAGRRVVRGGSWCCEAGGCRAAYRRAYDVHARAFDVGFRVVRVAP